MKERIIALMTAVCLLFCMGAVFALPATAAEAKLSISTAQELVALAQGDLSGNYILKADIDLTGVDYTPIGNAKTPFTGTFDGNGYIIDGLQLESDAQFQGLFGVNNGTIRNVTLGANCSIYGSAQVGAIAGRNNGTIEGCISHATVGHYAAVEANGNTYSVMSQNLCQWGDDDLTAYDDYVDSTVHSRRPPMLQRIRNADPDILLFQEVSFNVHHKNGIDITSWNDYLRAQLTDYTFFGMYRSETDFEGILVAYKTEKFNYIDDGIFWLSANPDAPRAEQTKGWDGSHVRTCHWVLVEDKVTGQKVAGYSTHLDVGGATARELGGKLIAERMALLQQEYPDTIFFVGGDFNERPGKPGYTYIDRGLNGMLDDGRYVAEERLNNEITHGSIDNLELTGSHEKSIDFIFADSAKAEVETFWVMNDNYDNLRPSDHQGVYITARALENNYVGGIAGSNNGTIRAVIANGTFDGGEAEGNGAVLGANDYNSKTLALYATDTAQENLIGEAFEVTALPQEASQKIVDTLNANGGVFQLLNGEYRIVEHCGEKDLVQVTINGEERYLFAGSVYTVDVEIPEGALVYLDGQPFSGSSILVPPEGFTLSVATPAAQVTEKVSAGDFTVSDITEWMHVYNNLICFASPKVTIHLLCDIDLTDPAAEGFAGFINPAFSLEGHGNTISNWGSREAPGGVSLFRVTKGEGGMKFIRDLNVVNCHVAGSNSAVLYAPTHANGGLEGLPTEFSVTNVTLDRCSMVTSGQASGLLISRYGSTGRDFTVNVKNCRLLNSYVDANHSEHVGLLIGKLRSTDAGTGTFNLSDCYLVENEVANTIEASGFICGNAEANAYVNITNVGLFNNTGSGTEFSYICANNETAPKIKADGILIAGNTVTADESYLFGSMTNNSSAVGTNIFSDAEVTAYRDGTAVEYTPDAAPLLSGEAGYIVNSLYESPSFYWAKDDAVFYRPATKGEQVRKVTVCAGDQKQTFYCNNGTSLALDAPAAGGWFIAEGSSTLFENQLTVLSDTLVVQAERTSQVTAAVSNGDYTVEDLADWMALYENLSFFQNQAVTIHLRGDIDLSAAEAADFNGFIDPAFSLDGHGHTVSHWGSEEEPIYQRAMFVIQTGSCGMGYVKNLNLSDCHVTFDSYSVAILYSVAQGNGGLVGLPTDFTLENIHIDSSSVVGTEATSLLLSRYGVTNENFTVNIRNCSVQNSKIDANNEAHSGLLIGKPRYAGSACTYNISDCYLYNNAITDGSNGAGFIFGTAEAGSTTMNVENVGVVGNTLSGTDAGAYIGYADGSGEGQVNLTNLILQGNTMETEGTYLVGTNASRVRKVVLTDVYSDIVNLTAPVEADSSVTYQSNPAQIATGEATYLLNQAIGDAPFYWRLQNGKVVTADGDDRTVKLTLALAEGTVVNTLYAAGGDQVDLTLKKDPEATFDTFGKAALSGNLLTVPVGGEDLSILVNPANSDAYLPNYRDPVTTVTGPVYEGTYTVNSVEEWMYLYENFSYFNCADVTIALGADIDLSDEKAADFAGFKETCFSLDGGSHTVKNWTYRNQDAQNYGCALFSEFKGKAIKNLDIENFDLSGDYGRAILIAGYSGVDSVTIENVHIRDSILDANNNGNQMAAFLSRPTVSAASGATITLRNCSLENVDMTSSGGSRINNSGLLIGSAFKDFTYVIENCMIRGCAVETKTGAGGMVIGAIESGNTKVTMDRVAIFDSTALMASTNERPGVFVGEMAAGSLTIKNCMAADLSAEGQESLALLKHSETNITVSASNCFTDFEPVELFTANNATGAISENLGAVEGVSQLTSAAFKSGEAAWTANNNASATLWQVEERFGQYPTSIAKEGVGAPFKITFGEAAFYTNAQGLLAAEAQVLLSDLGGLWKNGEEAVTAETLFAADADLIFEAHTFLAENAAPDGEGFHKILCSDEGCTAEKRLSCSYTHQVNPLDEEGIHEQVCICGNAVQEDCSFAFISEENGNHFERCSLCLDEKESVACGLSAISKEGDLHVEYCADCGYEKAAEPCVYTYTHVAETDTHIGECGVCFRSLEAVACTFDAEGVILEGQAPTVDQAGLRTFYCTAECGHYDTVVLPRLAHATLKAEVDPLILSGEEFEVRLTLEGNADPGLNDLTAVLTYDANAMLLSDPEQSVAVEGFEAELTHEVSEGQGLLTITAHSDEAITAETFATVTFTATRQPQYAGVKTITAEVRDAYLGGENGEPLDLQCGAPASFRLHFSSPGDVNRSGDVSISDAVVLLRVIGGELSLDQIDVEAANLYTADEITQNGGITTADAIEVLKLVLP